MRALGMYGHRRCAVAGDLLGRARPDQLGVIWSCHARDEPMTRRSARSASKEPDAGSERARAMRTPRATTTRPRGGLVVERQEKAWATNGGMANIHDGIRVGRPGDRRPRSGRLSDRARTHPRAWTMGTKVKKHRAARPTPPADVFLDDCRIRGAWLLGERQGEARRAPRRARPREGNTSDVSAQAAMQTFEATRTRT